MAASSIITITVSAGGRGPRASHLRVESDELEAAQPWHVERDEVRAGERQHDAQGKTAKLQVARPPGREVTS